MEQKSNLNKVYENKARFRLHLTRQAETVDQFDDLGLSPAEVQELKDDAVLAEWLDETCDEMSESSQTANGIRSKFYGTDTETPAGKFKAAPVLTPPVEIKSGAERRSRERDQKILANKPSEASKIGMDLYGDQTTETPDSEIKPTAEIKVLSEPYKMEVTIRGKGKADMSEVEIRRIGDEKWEAKTRGTGRTLTVEVEPTAEGKSEQLQVRVRLYYKDEPYGEPSDPQYATLNP